jgi:quercetin dioxygenase-like cupin family protein
MSASQIHTRVLLRSEQTNDQLSVVQNVLPPGFGPPLHHHDFDETFYVLEGEIVFQVDGERITGRAGDLAFVPRNAVHTLANLSDAPARYLLVITPAGFERYFDRIAATQAGSEPPPEASRPYPETIVVGPPLT